MSAVHYAFRRTKLSHSRFERALEGDAQSVAEIVEALRPRITKMSAYYACRSGEDPDDLQQEAWVGVLESLPSLDLGIGSPDQFLIQRARWRVLDAVKRSRLRRCLPLSVEMEDVPGRAGPDIGRTFVLDFTCGLKKTQRAVLGCLLSGLTWREAGARLGCTSPNIAYHVREIRRRYDEWDREPAL
jgi:RNA polymerase sigma-70 factor (ECF subfamily)